MIKIKKIIRKILKIFIIIFAIIGFFFVSVFFAMKFNLTNVKGSIDSRNSFYNTIRDNLGRQNYAKADPVYWVTTPEWFVLREALIKDKDQINQASFVSDVPSRLIVSSIIAEQLRFFTSNRESFKKFFEPLKILGNETKFSYGVAGIKEDTAIMIENNLKNRNSIFYPGVKYENVLDFTTNDIQKERIDRLTDAHNHYYSYFYTALYLKEIMAQWKNSGFDISNRPEVLSTLFNIGFSNSKPKESPEVGGSTITLVNQDYTFGGLSYEFYYSNELREFFPFEVQ